MAEASPQDFAGRVALITGAARGLGRAVAERLIERGAQVAINVRGRARAEAVAAGIGAFAVPGDVAEPGLPARLVAATVARFGRLDVLVNNAAFAHTTRFEQLTLEEWRTALEVNMTAPFLLMQAAVPVMKAQGYGRIVNLSSTAGRMVSTLGGAHYTASKTGLLGLTRESASDESLTAHARGYPVPRLSTAREVADLICFAGSEAAGYITGASLDINGGDLMM